MRSGPVRQIIRQWPTGIALALALLSAGGCATSQSAARREFDLGFIASRDRDLEGNLRTRALGPFFERRVSPEGGDFSALRPLYSRSGNPQRERVLTEFLWPIAMHKTLGKETYWRFLLAYANDFDRTRPGSRYRLALFPLIFAGRDRHGERYFGFFPLGGKVHEYLGRDRIVFVLFPLYMHTTLGSQTRRHILWPLIGWGGSERGRHYGFLPFYARSVRDGAWDKRTVAWPFWVSARYDAPGGQGDVHMLWPLYWRGNLPNEKTWMFLPPLFRFTTADRLSKVHAPWPLVQWSRGDVDKLYLWPLWGRKSAGSVQSWFLFWPIVSGTRSARATGAMRQFKIMPFLHWRTVAGPPAANGEAQEPQEQYCKIWPLFESRRIGQTARLRLPSLWPGKTLPQLERNWEPFWTLYSRDRHGSVKEDEALWGLFRYRRDERQTHKFSIFPLFRFTRDPARPERRQWSFLMGLIGHERAERHNTLRLLFIPIRTNK